MRGENLSLTGRGEAYEELPRPLVEIDGVMVPLDGHATRGIEAALRQVYADRGMERPAGVIRLHPAEGGALDEIPY